MDSVCVDLVSITTISGLNRGAYDSPTSCIYSLFFFHRSIYTRVPHLVFSSQRYEIASQMDRLYIHEVGGERMTTIRNRHSVDMVTVWQ